VHPTPGFLGFAVGDILQKDWNNAFNENPSKSIDLKYRNELTAKPIDVTFVESKIKQSDITVERFEQKTFQNDRVKMTQSGFMIFPRCKRLCDNAIYAIESKNAYGVQHNRDHRPPRRIGIK
jgi:hypothetical protein